MKPLKIAEELYSRYETIHEVKNYYGLLAAWALAEVAAESDEKELLNKVRSYLSLYPDKFPHPGYYSFELYRVGGMGKAYLLYKGLYNEERENIRLYAEKTLLAPKNKDGILSRPRQPWIIWIDAAFSVVPFMLYSGLALGEEKYIDFAANQVFLLYDELMDSTVGLLHQCKGFFENLDKPSEDHWSRGNGWGYIALSALVEHLPKESPHRPKAEELFKAHSAAILRTQNERGVWRQEMPLEDSWEESSGTGIFAYGFGVGLRAGLLEKEIYEKPFHRAIAAIGEYFIGPDFSTKMCCSSCLCPGEGEEKGTVLAYITKVHSACDDPHSFGTLMLAMLEAHRNGIDDVKIGR